MIGGNKKKCPFCGAKKDKFMTIEEAMKTYIIKEKTVTSRVSRLNSFPDLGYEHAAYELKTRDDHVIWIDCPSSYMPGREPFSDVLFTHHHFLGSVNLYANEFGADVWLHELDANKSIARPFPISIKFEGNFVHHEIEAFHVDGHTDGFTIYFFENVLFTCDYFFFSLGKDMRYNPYSNIKRIKEQAHEIDRLVNEREERLQYVCGIDYVEPFESWRAAFRDLLNKA